MHEDVPASPPAIRAPVGGALRWAGPPPAVPPAAPTAPPAVPTRLPAPPPPGRRHRRPLVAAGLLAGVALAGGIALSGGGDEPREQDALVGPTAAVTGAPTTVSPSAAGRVTAGPTGSPSPRRVAVPSPRPSLSPTRPSPSAQPVATTGRPSAAAPAAPRPPTTPPPSLSPALSPAPAPPFALPSRALGLARDRAQSATAQAGFAGNADVRTVFGDPRAAVYGAAPSVVAYVGTTRLRDNQLAVAAFTASYNRNAPVDLGPGAGIRTLEAGGAGRCWRTTVSGTRAHVCVIAAEGVLFALVDPREPTDLSKAAERIRAVRAATLA